MPEVDAITKLFDGLAARGQEPLFGKATFSLRIEVTGKRPERWLIAVKNGMVEVSHRNSKADGTLRCDRGLFEDIVEGRANAMAAMLRGTLTYDGDIAALLRIQRLFRRTENTEDGREAAGYARRQP